MKRSSLLAAGACALVLAGCQATVTSSTSSGQGPSSFRAFNGMNVFADRSSPGTIAVATRPGAGPRDYWCAAGDYARRFLGVSATDRIVVERAIAPTDFAGGRRSVLFTTLPPPELRDGPRPGDGGDYTLRVDTPGFNVQAAQARSYCVDSRRRFVSPGLL